MVSTKEKIHAEMDMNTPSHLARCAQLAMVLEVAAHPKPGNVDQDHDFPDTTFEHFMASAVGTYPVLEEAARSRTGVGALIRAHYTICILSYLLDVTVTNKLREAPVRDVSSGGKVYSTLARCEVAKLGVRGTKCEGKKLMSLTDVQKTLWGGSIVSIEDG